MIRVFIPLEFSIHYFFLFVLQSCISFNQVTICIQHRRSRVAVAFIPIVVCKVSFNCRILNEYLNEFESIIVHVNYVFINVLEFAHRKCTAKLLW